METFLSGAIDYIADLNRMQPIYTNFCIQSVESAVQTKINTIQIVAAKCRKCSECAGKGYYVPSYISNTCPIPQGVGGVLISTFNQASSYLATFESAWENYREDENRKVKYILSKLNRFFAKCRNVDDFLTPYSDRISYDTYKFNDDYVGLDRTMQQQIFNLNYMIELFNNYFSDQIDQLVLRLNQQLKNVLISNWNNTGCRNGLLNTLFYEVDLFSNDWNNYMSSLFYIVDLDTEISVAYTEMKNFSLSVENCAKANSRVKISCLNQVKLFQL